MNVQDKPAGFTGAEWVNETAWVQAWITRTFANGLPAGPALPMLLDDGYNRVLNYIAGISNGSIEVRRGGLHQGRRLTRPLKASLRQPVPRGTVS